MPKDPFPGRHGPSLDQRKGHTKRKRRDLVSIRIGMACGRQRRAISPYFGLPKSLPREMREAPERENLVSVEQEFQFRDQVGSSAGFAYKTLRTQQANGGLGLGRALPHGQEENFSGRCYAAYFEGGLDAVHLRHIDIEEHQVGV